MNAYGKGAFFICPCFTHFYVGKPYEVAVFPRLFPMIQYAGPNGLFGIFPEIPLKNKSNTTYFNTLNGSCLKEERKC